VDGASPSDTHAIRRINMAKKKKDKQEPKICFVVAPIGEPETETRRRSDQLLKHVIAPIVEPRGYKTLRADQIPEPGMITPQVVDRVRDSALVIADLAERNPNVFYELAIRHAERKPLIQIMAKGEEIPFDVQDMRTISVDIHDLDSVEEARQQLSNQVDAIESGDFQMNTPISMALDLRARKESGDPGQRALADQLEAIAELAARLTRQEQRLEQLRYQKAAESSRPGLGSGFYGSDLERVARKQMEEMLRGIEERGRVAHHITPTPEPQNGANEGQP
jgi:hypothetical protein